MIGECGIGREISRGGHSLKFSAHGACLQVSSAVTLRYTMPDATIHTVGKILEQLNPILYRVSLPNGKIILAHLSKPLTEAGSIFTVGEQIVAELTAYDFDQARILGAANP
jgi:translation initiation factor IF-1